MLLFGEFVKSRPFHGTKQHWRDVVNADLESLNVSLKDWYESTMNRNAKVFSHQSFLLYSMSTGTFKMCPTTFG